MVRALGWIVVLAGLLGTVATGFLLFAAINDWLGRCPGAAQCSDAVSVIVLGGCGLIASLIMIAAGLVMVRR